MNVFAFDIETIPDVSAGRRLLGIDGALDDADVAKAMFHRRSQEAGTEFQRHYLHQIVAISVAFRSRDGFRVWSLGTESSDERELVERFFAGIEKYSPTLVTWNGGGFDLPVLHYRALLHGVQAERYWEMGDNDTAFRWNNYLNRYHYRHTDLMEVLAGFQGRANAPLNEIALLLGLPGKMGMDGGEVWPTYLRGELGAIRDYCETDVLNTYLVYLRWEMMRGRFSPSQYADECALVKASLDADDAPAHLREFSAAWQSVAAN
ncbi:MAG: 3'-5' exonuclease [Gammaproteobacteria bacterium]|nr:3'-5' exonuclease [Gammaproteobacteria bacterium]